MALYRAAKKIVIFDIFFDINILQNLNIRCLKKTFLFFKRSVGGENSSSKQSGCLSQKLGGDCMKKLIAISVVFALITGALFAQAAVSASVETRWMVATSNTENGLGKAYTGGGVNNGTIGVAGSNDDGTYGGVFKLAFVGNDNNGTRDDMVIDFAKFDRAFVWWKPIDQITLKLGHDGDGQWGTTDLIRWGHFNMPRNIATENWNQHGYLLGHWDHSGFSIGITPMDNLFINLAIALGKEESIQDDLADGMMIQAGYILDGIGKITLTYLRAKEMWPIYSEDGRLGLTFFSNEIVDGLAFEVGGNVNLDMPEEDGNLFRFGAGAHWNGGDFGVKFRLWGGPVLGKTSEGDYLQLYADIMPWYNISDSVGTFYLNIRFALSGVDTIDWNVTPYLRNSMGGAGDFRIGAQFASQIGDAVKDDRGIDWKIATAWVLSF
jgi:hypothetical protein